jgi:hypothetical protein
MWDIALLGDTSVTPAVFAISKTAVILFWAGFGFLLILILLSFVVHWVRATQRNTCRLDDAERRIEAIETRLTVLEQAEEQQT